MAGTGKRTALTDALRRIAEQRRLPFTVQMKVLASATEGSAAAGETEADGTAGPADAEAGQFQYETSLVHTGLDIARMSMQDKHILRPVLTKLGQGSHVLAGEQGRGARILVLYHAHLLSSESVLLLQACLEQNEGDLSVWLTSEMPVPQRIRDWFVEIPVAGQDRNFEAFRLAVKQPAAANWPQIFRAIVDRWRSSPPPKLQEVKEIKFLVYEMLMRNLRWVEAAHFLLDVLLEHEALEPAQRAAAIKALATCEATAGGYTIPSYRIPILWESLFLQLRTIFVKRESQPVTETTRDDTSRARRVVRPRKKGVGAGATGSVGAV